MTLLVQTLSNRIFDIVRERIVTGHLPEREPIRQDALAAELGVSKIPLREALARLEQEGLLVSHANRGYIVRPISADECDEIYALRLLVEPGAAAHAAGVADEKARALAQEVFQKLDQAAAHCDLADVALCNRMFHTALVRPGDRLLTTQLVERLAIHSERYVIAHLRPAGRDARAHHEHRALIDAWLARDEQSVQALLTAHLQATLDDLRIELRAADRRPQADR